MGKCKKCGKEILDHAQCPSCGKLSPFITFTANPNWQEINENLKKHEVNLVTYVFQLKLIKKIKFWKSS